MQSKKNQIMRLGFERKLYLIYLRLRTVEARRICVAIRREDVTELTGTPGRIGPRTYLQPWDSELNWHHRNRTYLQPWDPEHLHPWDSELNRHHRNQLKLTGTPRIYIIFFYLHWQGACYMVTNYGTSCNTTPPEFSTIRDVATAFTRH